ncbi:protein of unknown function [Pararobbsia alpina]|uniref:hypothetical protein n=1 Tax=Pararobbsia alpina TaxID=621374 RepID=UPI0039A68C18
MIKKTLKAGIMSPAQFKAWTIAIASGQVKPSPNDPKVWFQSIESFSKVLSEGNRGLLAIIAEAPVATGSDCR